MTSKTTIGEREKGRKCHNQLDNNQLDYFAAGDVMSWTTSAPT
jgi:hypothetical protein